MGRRKKVAAKPAAPAAASTAPKSDTPAPKTRGRGRPRKYPLAVVPVKEEENSQSSVSTPDDISQDVPPASSPEPAVPSDDSSTATGDLPANNSKKFGKFRILHSSSPSSSSGEQPSEWASKVEAVSTPPVAETEEIVIESAMEVEIAPEPIEEDTVVEEETVVELVEEESIIEPVEEQVMEVVHEELVQEEVVNKEEEVDDIKEEVEIAMENESPDPAVVEEKEEDQSPETPDEETKDEVHSPEDPEEEMKEEVSENLEPADFEKLSIKTETEKRAAVEPKKSKGDHTDENDRKSEDDKHKSESSHSTRRRSSRIKTIKATIDKVKAEKRVQQREMKGAKEKEVSPEGTPIDESTSDSFPLPQGPPPSCIKPVKVKSRWRRSSELEMVSNYSPSQGMSPVASPTPSPVPPPSPKVFQPLSADEERLRNFRRVDKNIYLTQRDTNKETKRMVCDCEPVDDDEMGCGEDCLNRMLMIECGPRCPLGDKCSNKRFQKMEYSPIDVFRTEKKGFGLQAKGNIKGGAFLAEYVGEVLDPYEFQCRAEDYANDKNRHYYFMALKSDAIIDATVKGNNSRFINHSCDPNAETQKWTVNGELRIGFFSIKDITAGDEVTFDYQLQRYGKEAQKCYCEAANCRGWIGGDPDKEDKEEDRSRKGTKSVEKKDKKSKPKPKFSIVQELLEDQDLENEVTKLCQTGLKNRTHTLNLSRLMVRVEKQDKRKRMLNLLQLADSPCRRLFLDYHGLRLVWSWMVDPNNKLRLEIMETLDVLPLTNKTVLQETKIFGVVEKWEEESRPPTVTETPVIKEPEEKSPVEVVTQEEPPKQAEETEAKPDDVEMEDLETKKLEEPVVKTEIQLMSEDKEGSKDSPDTSTPKEEEPAKKDKVVNKPVIDLERLAAENIAAKRLLEHWSGLPEVFRIPKKERKEQLREHEREAERSYQSYLDNRGYRAEYNDNNDRSRQKRYRGSVSASRDREIRSETRKPLRSDRYEDRVFSGMDKFQRRQLFAQRVEQEERAKKQQMWLEEQERERQKQLSILQEQQQQQQMQAPHILMDANGVPCFFDAATNSWHAYHAQPALTPQQQESPRFEPSAWQQVYQIPIAPLPPKWRAAYDKDGLPFYYHLKKRVPQWEPPSLVPPPGSLSSSDDFSSSSETESVEETDDEDGDSGSSDEETPQDELAAKKADDDDSDEDDDVKENEGGEPGVPGEEEVELKNKDEDDEADDEEEKSETVQPKRENRRREGLVQELIIISPRREEDMPSIPSRIRYRKNKEQVRKEKEAALRKKHELHKSKDKSRDKTQRTIKIKSSAGSGDADAEKKIKDDFLAKMASTVVSTLNPFLKPECKQGRITCSEDFKHLARRLTNFVMLKELKHCRKVSDLTCNDSVRHKAREYIKKYMAKFGELYKRDNEKEHRGERHGQPGTSSSAQERQDDADYANYDEPSTE